MSEATPSKPSGALSGPTNREPLGKLTQSDHSNPKFGYDVYESDVVADVFADGVLQSVVGPFTTRLILYRVDGVIQSGERIIEQRRVVLSIVLPTVALTSFSAFLAGQLATNRKALETSLDEFRRALAAFDQNAIANAILQASPSGVTLGE